MSLSLLNIPFDQQDNILKATISLISSSSSSSSSLSISSTYTFTSLVHSLQRRGLLSILNKKLLVKVKDRKCWVINNSTNNNDRDDVFWATPLQVSLLLGNMKTTQLLLSLGGIEVLYDKKSDDNNNYNNYNNLSDEDAMSIGRNIKNMKTMNEFIKSMK
jgi:hypothetical protein